MKRILRDYRCDACLYTVQEFGEIDDSFFCKCGVGILKHIWLSAPNSNDLGKDGSEKSVAAMKESFNKRFIKKGIDDVRHKHGEAFDQSLLGAAVSRIKK